MYQPTQVSNLLTGTRFRTTMRHGAMLHTLDGYDRATRRFWATTANGDRVSIRPRRKVYAHHNTFR